MRNWITGVGTLLGASLFSVTAEAGSWKVVDIAGAAPVGSPTVMFEEDRAIAVDTGCNRLKGSGSLDEKLRLVTGPMAATKMACEDALMRQ